VASVTLTTDHDAVDIGLANRIHWSRLLAAIPRLVVVTHVVVVKFVFASYPPTVDTEAVACNSSSIKPPPIRHLRVILWAVVSLHDFDIVKHG